jgi:Restriction Endonuclease associating with ARP
MDMAFDRTISPELLAAIGPDGPLGGLLERRHQRPDVLDVQLRRDQKGTVSSASLYVGLSSVLDLEELRGRFRLKGQASHRQAGGFPERWSEWHTAAELASGWPEVDGYLDRLLAEDAVARRLWSHEGLLQSAIASARSPDYAPFQRDVAISFATRAVRDAITAPRRDRIWTSVQATAGTGTPSRTAQGPVSDFLAADALGRLLVIEARPADEPKQFVGALAQVRLSAELFAELLNRDPDSVERLRSCLEQRGELGLLESSWKLEGERDLRIVPVLAIGHGVRSPVALGRLADRAAALDASPGPHPRLDPLEVWLLDQAGTPVHRWIPVQGPPPADVAPSPPPAPVPGQFTAEARGSATKWKSRTATLSAAARAPGRYGTGPPVRICLPVACSTENLLPEAREIARQRFAAASIRWHGGADGPSNHLLSSQVQCLNALAPLVERPGDLGRLLRRALPVDEVLPFSSDTPSRYDRTDCVVFEWQGLGDHLGEWGGRTPKRGAHVTSADAAVRYRSTEGHVELALIEWKYTERYPDGQLRGGEAGRKTRLGRYEASFADPQGPMRNDLLACTDLFVEPLYQLLRLQLLAWRVEQARELGAEVVRVLYVAPAANVDLLGSVPAPLAHLGGPGLLDLWRSLLRRPDRIAYLDTAVFVADAAPTSVEFKDRYGHLAGNRRATGA